MKAVVVVLLAIGCGGKDGPSVDELVKQLGPKIEPKLVTAEKIAKSPLPEPTGKIALAGPPIAWVQYFPPDPVKGNATIAFDADLKDLHELGFVPVRYEHLAILNDCWMNVREQKQAGVAEGRRAAIRDEAMMKDRLPACAALKYLVVVRLDEFQATEYVDKEHFKAGHARATAFVFDLDTGAYLGGVPVETSSRNYIKDPDGDLRDGFQKALETALGMR